MRWVRYFLVVCILFSSCQSNQTISVSDSDRLRVLKHLYEIYYEKEIAAELSYQKYLLEVENEKK